MGSTRFGLLGLGAMLLASIWPPHTAKAHDYSYSNSPVRVGTFLLPQEADRLTFRLPANGAPATCPSRFVERIVTPVNAQRIVAAEVVAPATPASTTTTYTTRENYQTGPTQAQLAANQAVQEAQAVLARAQALQAQANQSPPVQADTAQSTTTYILRDAMPVATERILLETANPYAYSYGYHQNQFFGRNRREFVTANPPHAVLELRAGNQPRRSVTRTVTHNSRR